ncbi:MAG: glycosyl hydrolase 2 galactose-binding domain-containing protein [Vibrio sp.]
MQLILDEPWQLSPLTDLSLPQNDLTLPSALSKALPNDLSNSDIVNQEWHLMHDVEIDEALYQSTAAYDLIIAGIDYDAQVRVNGIAVFDCDRSQSQYRKDITHCIHKGKNRVEILFVQEEEDLFGEVASVDSRDAVIGIWQAPIIHTINHVRLQNVTIEQVWHYDDLCELLVMIDYEVLKADLISATIKFDGLTYHVPLDMRATQAQSIFQVDAPHHYSSDDPASDYHVYVEVDGQSRVTPIHFVPHYDSPSVRR